MGVDRGILFVASGADYLRFAADAANRLKRIWPEIKLALSTTESDIDEKDLADIDILLDTPTGFDPLHEKLLAMANPPFARTLFLDVDTYLLEPVPELFDILDDYHVAASLVPGRRPGGPILDAPPACVVEINTGVVAYRNSARVRRSFLKGAKLYAEGRASDPADPRYPHDQPALNAAMWDTKLKIFQLGAEYNLRPNRPSYLRSEVKIVHAWMNDPESVIQKVKGKQFPRVVEPFGSTVNKSRRLTELRRELSDLQSDNRVKPYLGKSARHPVIASQVLPNSKRRIEILCPSGDKGVVESVIAKGEYLLPQLPGLIPKCIIDIGAHVGTASAVFAARYAKAVIHAFEPSHFNVAFAERNLKDLEDRVTLHAFGLSDRPMQTSLYHGTNLTAASSIYAHSNSSQSEETVEIRSARQAFKELDIQGIDILKMDTEGAELNILRDLQDKLTDISAIILEYHSEHDRRKIDQFLSADFVLIGAEAHRPDRGTLTFVQDRLLDALSRQRMKRRQIG